MLQDSALNREGPVVGSAMNAGKVVHLVLLSPVALPDGKKGTAYSAQIQRVDEPVVVHQREFAGPLGWPVAGPVWKEVPGGGPSPIELSVTWTVKSGALPAGVGIDATTGQLTGTPTTPGTAHFEIETKSPIAASLKDTHAYDLKVKK